MQSPSGGFYSSFDADSEGHEGKFYVWDRREVEQVLDAREFAAVAARYGLGRAANFEGRWHLHVIHSMEDIARSMDLTQEEVESLLESARAKLFAARSRRVWPGRDEKILTSWNALMIRGMAIAARTLERAELAESATRALDFVRAKLWRDGRLLATHKDGHSHLNAYLDDYAFLADAVLELQQTRFRPEELEFGRQLLEGMLAHFTDARGGFFFTSDDHERLIHRSKSFSDEATPSGNGIAAFVLQRMGYLLGEPRYLQAAERTLRGGWRSLEQYPHGHASLLNGLEELLDPPEIVILRGPEVEIASWARQLRKLYAPRRLVLAVGSSVSGLPAALADKAPTEPADGAVAAYVCRGSTCSLPLSSLDSLLAALTRAS